MVFCRIFFDDCPGAAVVKRIMAIRHIVSNFFIVHFLVSCVLLLSTFKIDLTIAKVPENKKTCKRHKEKVCAGTAYVGKVKWFVLKQGACFVAISEQSRGGY